MLWWVDTEVLCSDGWVLMSYVLMYGYCGLMF